MEKLNPYRIYQLLRESGIDIIGGFLSDRAIPKGRNDLLETPISDASSPPCEAVWNSDTGVEALRWLRIDDPDRVRGGRKG